MVDESIMTTAAFVRMPVNCGDRPLQGGARRQPRREFAALTLLMLFAGGCSPVALTALGVGGSAGIQHTMSGVAYRTFTASLTEVRAAALAALDRMGTTEVLVRRTGEGELITARAGDRNIEIELVTITDKATRMRAVVRNGVLMDRATGTEIIVQTERTLGHG